MGCYSQSVKGSGRKKGAGGGKSDGKAENTTSEGGGGKGGKGSGDVESFSEDEVEDEELARKLAAAQAALDKKRAAESLAGRAGAMFGLGDAPDGDDFDAERRRQKGQGKLQKGQDGKMHKLFENGEDYIGTETGR